MMAFGSASDALVRQRVSLHACAAINALNLITDGSENFVAGINRGSSDRKGFMKRILLITTALVALSGLTLSASYSSSGSRNSGSASASSSRDSNREFRPPVKGETQAQYDDPDQVQKSGEGGDIWVYVFGKDKILGNEKLLIPSYGLFARVRVFSIHFDQAGRVTSWETAYVAFSKRPLISF
jgi:hypothetical protein